MLPEWISLLPPWLLAGLGVGAAASILIAGAFVAGDRLFPPADRNERGGADDARVDGTARRRAEIREQLVGMGEAFREDHPVHGRTVAFYLPERDVAITFDAQAYFRIERAGTYTVLCEHEMPGGHIGRRLPFEVSAPNAGGGPGDETTGSDSRSARRAGGQRNGSVGEAFARLGLSPDADASAVRAAYRERVKEVHPDQGGDPEEFRRVREAYATARGHAD